MNQRGALLALGSAVLFGLSTPAAKVAVGVTEPLMLAGLLYLGAGVGLALLRITGFVGQAEQSLQALDLPWLGGAIFFGGVVGPVLLMVGLSMVPASTASLLLTLESVLTALLAWFVFRENFDRRIALGMLAIAAGAMVLAWQPSGMSGSELLGIAAIAVACLAWAIDNNLTRKVALSDPVQIALLKGLVAGTTISGLAWISGSNLPSMTAIVAIGAVGFLGYGISLVLFVLALRDIGTARTGAYFSTAPFIGALASILLLDDVVSPALAIAGVLMATGIWLHLTERHEHEHIHEPVEHSHSHQHDIHHQHMHSTIDPPGEPHTHRHQHTRLRHRHAPCPDSHHQHQH